MNFKLTATIPASMLNKYLDLLIKDGIEFTLVNKLALDEVERLILEGEFYNAAHQLNNLIDVYGNLPELVAIKTKLETEQYFNWS